MTELFFYFGVDFSFNCITGADLIKQKEETPRGFKVIQVKFHHFIFKYKQLEVFCIKAACDQVIYALKKNTKIPKCMYHLWLQTSRIRQAVEVHIIIFNLLIRLV